MIDPHIAFKVGGQVAMNRGLDLGYSLAGWVGSFFG